MQNNNNTQNSFSIVIQIVVLFCFIWGNIASARTQQYVQNLTISNLENQLDQLSAEESSLNASMLILSSEATELENMVNTAQEELAAVQNQVNPLQTSYSNLESEVALLGEQSTDAQNTIIEQQSALANKETLAEQLQASIAEFELQISTLTTQLDSVRQDYTASKSEVLASINETRTMRVNFNELVARWEERVQKIIDSYEQRQLAESSQARSDVIKRYSTMMTGLLDEYRIVFDEIAGLYDAQVSAKLAEATGLDTSFERVEEASNSQLSNLNTSLNSSTTDMQSKHTEIDQITALLEQLSATLITHQQDTETKQQELVVIEQSLESLNVDHAELSENLQSAELAYSNKQNQVLALQADIDAIPTQVLSIQAQIAEIIADQQAALARPELIAQARTQIENIEYADTGSCQFNPSVGVLVACFESGKDDVVRITHQDLMSNGVDLRGTPREAIAVFTGNATSAVTHVEADDLFTANSYIEVVAEAYDSIYTDNKMYQIVVNIDEPFNKLVSTTPMVATTSTPSIGTHTLKVDKHTKYAANARINAGWISQNGYTRVYANVPTDLAFDFVLGDHVSIEETSSVKFKLAHSLVYYHTLSLKVKVNGQYVEADFPEIKARGDVEFTVDLPENVLNTSNNQIVFEAKLIAANQRGSVEIGDVELTYKGKAEADQESVLFTLADGNVNSVIQGVTSENAVAYSITSTDTASRFSAQGASIDTAAELPNVNSGRVIVSNQPSTGLSLIKPKQYSELPMSDAEYLIISHHDFIGSQALNDLVLLRSQDYSVKVVDVDDIYAHYSDGVFDAKAIQAYLKDMMPTGTEMVLLVGDDHYDYKGIKDFVGKSFIPSMYFYNPVTGPSDSRFVDLDDDGLPDAAIGRMPVESTEELANIVEKTIAYENHDYSNTATLITNYTNGIPQFLHNIIKTKFPFQNSIGYGAGWDIDDLIVLPSLGNGVTAELVSEVRDLALEELENGSSLTVYTGHNTAAAGHVLHDTHIDDMTNTLKPTVLLSIDSYTGRYFQDDIGGVSSVKAESLLVKKEVGAAAVLANASATGINNFQGYLLRNMIANQAIGEAHKDAFYWAQNSSSTYYNVLGDPALKLKATQL